MPLPSEAIVTQTPMICHTCRECLLRVMEPDKGADEVICLSCGGFGNYRDVSKGAALQGQVITQREFDILQERVASAMRRYSLNR